MMTLTITICMDNAIFHESPESANDECVRILRRLATSLKEQGLPSTDSEPNLYDFNGNQTGTVRLTK